MVDRGNVFYRPRHTDAPQERSHLGGRGEYSGVPENREVAGEPRSRGSRPRWRHAVISRSIEWPQGVGEAVAHSRCFSHTTTNYGQTPLHGAASDGHLGIIKLLFEKGADVNAKQSELSVLDNVTLIRNQDCIDYLRSVGARSFSDNSIFAAAAVGDIEAVSRFLRAGANPNSVLNDDTPLIALPVISGHEEMLELLLANGANLDAQVEVGEGLTLLDVALGREMVEMANLLAAKDAKKSCGRCMKPYECSRLRKLWRLPLWILKLVRMHPGEEAERLYCRLCSRSQNIGVLFLASMFLALLLITVAAITEGDS